MVIPQKCLYGPQESESKSGGQGRYNSIAVTLLTPTKTIRTRVSRSFNKHKLRVVVHSFIVHINEAQGQNDIIHEPRLEPLINPKI